jgi:hypothetical protein
MIIRRAKKSLHTKSVKGRAKAKPGLAAKTKANVVAVAEPIEGHGLQDWHYGKQQ